MSNPRVFFHVHPAGVGKNGGVWVQKQSPADEAAAVRNKINIVLGARDHRVYIYNSGGLIGGKSMSLKSFIGK
jgi:hypothetical protein